MSLGHQTPAAFARALGVKYATYRKWELHDAAPALGTLKRAVMHASVPEWEKLLLWLADGQGDEPRWLQGTETST